MKKKGRELGRPNMAAMAGDLAAAKLEAKGLRTGKFAGPVRVALPAKPLEVRQARRSLGVSQRVFAALVGVGVDTVKSWETGRRPPEGPASKLIRLIRKDSAFGELLAGV